MVEGEVKTLLVHRKGSTRAFPPHHPLIPVDYQFIGQPVLIGGTMGTCSYVLTGTQQGMFARNVLYNVTECIYYCKYIINFTFMNHVTHPFT